MKNLWKETICDLAEKPFVSVDRLIRDCGHYWSYTLKSLNEDEE